MSVYVIGSLDRRECWNADLFKSVPNRFQVAMYQIRNMMTLHSVKATMSHGG